MAVDEYCSSVLYTINRAKVHDDEGQAELHIILGPKFLLALTMNDPTRLG